MLIVQCARGHWPWEPGRLSLTYTLGFSIEFVIQLLYDREQSIFFVYTRCFTIMSLVARLISLWSIYKLIILYSLVRGNSI